VHFLSSKCKHHHCKVANIEDQKETTKRNKRKIVMGNPMAPPRVGGIKVSVVEIRVNIVGIRFREQRNTHHHGCETLFENFDPNH
jgi:hypothetical protein